MTELSEKKNEALSKRGKRTDEFENSFLYFRLFFKLVKFRKYQNGIKFSENSLESCNLPRDKSVFHIPKQMTVETIILVVLSKC